MFYLEKMKSFKTKNDDNNNNWQRLNNNQQMSLGVNNIASQCWLEKYLL